MIQQFHSYPYTQKNWKKTPKQVISTPVFTTAERWTIQKSMDEPINKMRYTYNWVLLSLKKADTWVKSLGHYAKWNKPGTKRQILYDSTYMRHPRVVKFADSMVVLTRGFREWGMGVAA